MQKLSLLIQTIQLYSMMHICLLGFICVHLSDFYISLKFHQFLKLFAGFKFIAFCGTFIELVQQNDVFTVSGMVVLLE